MKTLKLTSLLILIPFGMLLSETAAAYPEPLNSLDGSDKTCVLSKMSQQELKEKNDKSHSMSRVVVDLFPPADSVTFEQDREAQVHTCRLNFDPIETEQNQSGW